MSKVVIIILNWNGWKDTIECLESLYQIDYSNYDVVLVDNGSEDKSIEKIKEYCEGKIEVSSKFFKYDPGNKPIKVIEYTREEAENSGGKEKEISGSPSNRKLILIKNEKNYGFTEGNNIGIRYALKAFNPKYILLLNNDIVVDKSFLIELVKIADKDKNIGLIQSKILRYKDLSIDNVGFACDIFGYTEPIRNFDQNSTKGIKSKRKLFYLSGACIMINKNLILEVDKNGNLFDKDLFAYFEDVDLAWRARMLKYDIKVCLSSICYHKGSQTTKKFNINTFYLDYRNSLRVFLKNYSLFYIVGIVPVSVLFKLIIVIAKTIYFLNINYLKSFFKAIKWNIKEFPNTIKFRYLIQSTRRATDKEIIKYMEYIPLRVKVFLEKIGNGKK